MLSVRRCREILGQSCPLSDSQIDLLRQQCYALADLALEVFSEQYRNRPLEDRANTTIHVVRPDTGGNVQIPDGFKKALALIPRDERESVEERAAIIEFDGGLERDEAERAAFSNYLQQKTRQT